MLRTIEYIWLDGNKEPLLRSKTRVVDFSDIGSKVGQISLDLIPEWSFDGSSTEQATATSSDCILRPVFSTMDPFRGNYDILVLCDVLDIDRKPHKTNTRAKLLDTMINIDKLKSWIGFEQEYTLYIDKPQLMDPHLLAWPPVGEPKPQGPYYCGVGSDRVVGRSIMEKHLQYCLKIGLSICGTNAEVMPGQWEYQIGPIDNRNSHSPLRMSDELWLSRWILQRVAEDYGVTVSFDPKPLAEWNGAGLHTNFSTKATRADVSGMAAMKVIIKELEASHDDHIKEYGCGIEKRLVGKFETSSVDKFTWGFSDRTASVRIPFHVKEKGSGYIEDRRPNANADPYRVARCLLTTAAKCLPKSKYQEN